MSADPAGTGEVRRFPIQGADSRRITSIPWEAIAPHKMQAQANHDQTLETLANRGGLSADEAVAIIRGKRYREQWGSTYPTTDAAEAALEDCLGLACSLLALEARIGRAYMERRIHDLRGPWGPGGIAELLERGGVTPDEQEWLHRMAEEGR